MNRKTAFDFAYEEFKKTLGQNLSKNDPKYRWILSLANSLIIKDLNTHIHSLNVANNSLEIAKKLSLSDSEQKKAFISGYLHDIGKVYVDTTLLNSPKPLSKNEFEKIKPHPEQGGNILNSIPPLKEYKNIVKSHHERYDGKGYPNGISGENIPIQSRIISVADSYDAMINRPYAHKTNIEALDEINKHSAHQFDRNVSNAFFNMF